MPDPSPDPWRVDARQAITSAATSVRIIPRALRLVRFVPGTVNADIGGGRFDDASRFLASLGVENLVFDPFNRDPGHNEAVIARLRGGGADTATVLNVLNVIACPAARDRVVALAADAVGPDGAAWFQVYEGDRSGVGRRTPKGWQENRPLATYLPEIAAHFAEVTVSRGLARASLSLAARVGRARPALMRPAAA